MGNACRRKREDIIRLNQLLQVVDIGDIFLISSTTPLEPSTLIPPLIAHDIEFATNNSLSINRIVEIPEYDHIAIVVYSTFIRSKTKYLLELTANGFILSEMLGRLAEFKKRKFRVAYRHLQGSRGAEFEQTLARICDEVDGMTFTELPSISPIQKVKDRVLKARVSPPLNSAIMQHIHQVFLMFSDSPTSLKVAKKKFNNFMRELIGVHLDFTDEEMGYYFRFQNEITMDQFIEKWMEKDGKARIETELYEPSAYDGEMMYFIYNELGVMKPMEPEPIDALIPDDFTSLSVETPFKNTSLVLDYSYYLEGQVDIVM